MLTKNRQDIPQTDDLIYADPPSGHRRKPDPASRRRAVLIVLALVSLAACLTTAGVLVRNIRHREERYLQAKTLLTQHAYQEAIEEFEALGDYRDSQEQFARLNQLRTAYDDAMILLERAEAGMARTHPIDGFLAAAEALEALGDYADAPELAAYCRTRAEALQAESP